MKDLCNKNLYMTQVISGLKISDRGNGLCRGLKVICQEVNSLRIDVPNKDKKRKKRIDVPSL